jgi:glutamyl-tRNA(Gln) amidotransferase subunit D
VRKNHTSRRDAFASVGVPPAAVWGRDGLEDVEEGLPPRGGVGKFKPRTKFDSRVSLLKFYPSMSGRLISWMKRQGYKGLVLEGTGLGHVSAECITSVREFLKGEGVVAMTSQCMNGRVDLNVYDTGRDLLQAGVIPLKDMLAETAFAKMMWALGNFRKTSEVASIMSEDLVGEITDRSFPG